MQSRLPALYTFSLQYQMNRNNVSYVQYWIFGNFSLLNYPTITNIFAVDQIIRYNGVFAIRRPRYNEQYFRYHGHFVIAGFYYCITALVAQGWTPLLWIRTITLWRLIQTSKCKTYFDPHWYSLFRGAVSIPVQLRQTQIWPPPPPRLCGSFTVL